MSQTTRNKLARQSQYALLESQQLTWPPKSVARDLPRGDEQALIDVSKFLNPGIENRHAPAKVAP